MKALWQLDHAALPLAVSRRRITLLKFFGWCGLALLLAPAAWYTNWRGTESVYNWITSHLDPIADELP